MKNRIAAALLLTVAVAAFVSAATTETRTSGKASTVIISGASTNDVTWTLGYGAQKPISAYFTFPTSITNTVSVSILRNSTNHVIGSLTSTGTTFALDFTSDPLWLHAGESLVINAGATNTSLISIALENPAWD